MRSGTDLTLFLWGPPAVGKTTIGRRLARVLGRTFIDTDAQIVKGSGLPIASIFAQLGEPAFRELESDVIAAAATHTGAVISLGGGAVIAARNRQLIAQAGRSIHLRASVATIENRLLAGRARARRPLLAAGIPVETLVAERLALYESADHSIDVDRRRIDEIVAEICALL